MGKWAAEAGRKSRYDDTFYPDRLIKCSASNPWRSQTDQSINPSETSGRSVDRVIGLTQWITLRLLEIESPLPRRRILRGLSIGCLFTPTLISVVSLSRQRSRQERYLRSWRLFTASFSSSRRTLAGENLR